MARPVSEHVIEVKRKLIDRIRQNAHQPGDRFLSNRAIADQYGISYQTANRVMRDLVTEGHLVRRSAAGTFLPGEASRLTGALLLFDKRAKRKESFGARLLLKLGNSLNQLRVEWSVRWMDPSAGLSKMRLPEDRLPVLWNLPNLISPILSQKRRALLLNDRAPSGVEATLLDSVEVDDFSGGACAAQLLRNRSPGGKFAVVAGPLADARSTLRVQGFMSLAHGRTVGAGGWYYEHAEAIAAQAIEAGKDGIFCCNDRHAHALIDYCKKNNLPIPPVVGFDNAPIAERLGLTTIAIPWTELTDAAAALVRLRLRDHHSTASHRVFAPQPIVRWVTH